MDLGRAQEQGPRAESALRVVALMVLSIGLVIALGTLAFLPLLAVAHPCPVDAGPCPAWLEQVVVVLMLLVPLAAVAAGIAGGTVQLVRRRRAMRWPSIACAVAIASWLAGLAVVLVTTA